MDKDIELQTLHEQKNKNQNTTHNQNKNLSDTKQITIFGIEYVSYLKHMYDIAKSLLAGIKVEASNVNNKIQSVIKKNTQETANAVAKMEDITNNSIIQFQTKMNNEAQNLKKYAQSMKDFFNATPANITNFSFDPNNRDNVPKFLLDKNNNYNTSVFPLQVLCAKIKSVIGFDFLNDNEICMYKGDGIDPSLLNFNNIPDPNDCYNNGKLIEGASAICSLSPFGNNQEAYNSMKKTMDILGNYDLNQTNNCTELVNAYKKANVQEYSEYIEGLSNRLNEHFNITKNSTEGFSKNLSNSLHSTQSQVSNIANTQKEQISDIMGQTQQSLDTIKSRQDGAYTINLIQQISLIIEGLFAIGFTYQKIKEIEKISHSNDKKKLENAFRTLCGILPSITNQVIRLASTYIMAEAANCFSSNNTEEEKNKFSRIVMPLLYMECLTHVFSVVDAQIMHHVISYRNDDYNELNREERDKIKESIKGFTKKMGPGEFAKIVIKGLCSFCKRRKKSEEGKYV